MNFFWLGSSGQLGVCPIHAYPKCSHKASHQSVDFVLDYTQDDVKTKIFLELPISFVVEGAHPI